MDGEPEQPDDEDVLVRIENAVTTACKDALILPGSKAAESYALAAS